MLGFCILYALALAALLAGTVGWLADRDPLSAVFVVVLGQPWVRWMDRLPEALWPLAAALTPAINAAILFALCRLVRRA